MEMNPHLKEVSPGNHLRKGTSVHHEVEQLASNRQFQYKDDNFPLQAVLLRVLQTLMIAMQTRDMSTVQGIERSKVYKGNCLTDLRPNG